MFALPLLLTMATSAPSLRFYIGTYTAADGSKGIYRSELNYETGALAAPELAAESNSPSYLAIHPNHKFIYACHEYTKGEASAYAIEPSGALKLINTEKFDGLNPCHVMVDPAGKNLLVAAYSGGTLVNLPIKADGSLAKFSSFFHNSGSGPDKGRQEGPHMHAAYTDAAGKMAYACDLGTDEVIRFSFDAASGVFKKVGSSKVPPGGGPRHMALHPNGKFAYVCNEMTVGVTAFSRSSDGDLKPMQTLSSLPAGVGVKGNSTAEIQLHPSGKWLYVSNRGHNSIAVYGVQSNGHLNLVEIASAGVKTPRGFSLDPSGRWLVVGGQDNDVLTTLKVDSTSGKLKPTGHTIKVPKPVSVLFG